jgi:AraC-like DNA-binding protein
MPALRPAHVDLWSDRALVVAQLGRVSRHAHAATALLVGLDGEFGIQLHASAHWHVTRTAWLPAGVSHELDCGRTLMATLYLFPLTGEPEALARELSVDATRVSIGCELPAVIGEALLGVHAGDRSHAATRAWLDAWIGSATAPDVDARVWQAASSLREHAAGKLTIAELAETVEMSESRLMHLFKLDAGIPMRRFRQWERMRLLTEHVAAGDSLTMAALAAGFADSSHLSHGFRDMFGLAASRILNAHSRLRAD